MKASLFKKGPCKKQNFSSKRAKQIFLPARYKHTARKFLSLLMPSITKLLICFVLKIKLSAAKLVYIALTFVPGKCLAVSPAEITNDSPFNRQQRTNTALTCWHGNHHCLPLFGLPRSSTHHTRGCDDGTTTAAPSACRSHYKGALIYRFLVKKTQIIQIFSTEVVFFTSTAPLTVTGPADLSPSNHTYSLTGQGRAA